MHYRSIFGRKARLYLDHAAASPVRDSVVRVVRSAERMYGGNPSSLHHEGVTAGKELALARASIANMFEVQASEVIFTSGGTESDSLAIMGTVRANMVSFQNKGKTPHAITTAIEHPAVLEAFRVLELEGVSVTYLGVDTHGRIDQKELRESLREETVLVSIGYVNSEIGTVQDIRECAKTIRHFRKSLGRSSFGVQFPLFHTDAAQATRLLSVRVPELGVDMLSCNGSKIGGPRGVGMLYIKKGIQISALIVGGGQEHSLRSGTENLPAILGFTEALREVRAKKESQYHSMLSLRELALSLVQKHIPGARINGSTENFLPSTLSISLPKFSSELLVIELDARGIAVSAGSACSGVKENGSHVLSALYGADDAKEWGTVRISFGKNTKKRDVYFFVRALCDVMEKYSDILYT
jgi:cysteine desulfurase